MNAQDLIGEMGKCVPDCEGDVHKGVRTSSPVWMAGDNAGKVGQNPVSEGL